MVEHVFDSHLFRAAVYKFYGLKNEILSIPKSTMQLTYITRLSKEQAPRRINANALQYAKNKLQVDLSLINHL